MASPSRTAMTIAAAQMMVLSTIIFRNIPPFVAPISLLVAISLARKPERAVVIFT